MLFNNLQAAPAERHRVPYTAQQVNTHLVGGLPWAACVWVTITKLDLAAAPVLLMPDAGMQFVPGANYILHLQHHTMALPLTSMQG